MSAQTLPHRLAMGAAAVLRPREAARLLPGVGEDDALDWLREAGLVQTQWIGGRRRDFVVWADVLAALRDRPETPTRRAPPVELDDW